MNSKHKAVWDWLQACPHVQDLFFNAARVDGGNTQLIPSESLIESYIDGSRLMSYDCALTRYQPISFEANDEANLEDTVDIDRLAEWVEAQSAAGNYPAFPDGCAVQEISVQPNEAGWMVMLDAGIAKYMIQFRIEYLKGAK